LQQPRAQKEAALLQATMATPAAGAAMDGAAVAEDVVACPALACRACHKAEGVVAASAVHRPAFRWISGLSPEGKQPSGGKTRKSPCLSAVRQSSKELLVLLAQ